MHPEGVPTKVSKRIAVIQGKTIDIADDNVVFMDDVDSAAGPRVARTMSLPRAMPGSAGELAIVLGTSPEIMAFLGCDARPPDAAGQRFVERLCLVNIGKDGP